MIEMFGAVAVVAFFAVAIVWRIRKNRRERSVQRDETVRAGEAEGLDGDAAARNALDRTAWSRMYGP
jgi:hypothetical protein